MTERRDLWDELCSYDNLEATTCDVCRKGVTELIAINSLHGILCG